MNYQFEPIETWPRKATVNRQSGDKFQAAYTQTLTDLDYELTKLRAKDIVIQIGLDRQHIRKDGLPRSNAPKPWHPGIIVSFSCNKGLLRFLCDTYTSWKANLRAITKLLERLRLLDLDSVAQDDEPYRGWQALPPAPESPTTNEEKAASYLSALTSFSTMEILTDTSSLKKAYYSAVEAHHPDKGGSKETFQAVQEAYERLKARHGL